MKNVKGQICEALLKVASNLTDLYPNNWASLPAVQYTEEENNVVERTGNKEDKAYVRYRIDIWNGGSTSETAIQIDEAMSGLGLVRTGCKDVPDPSGLRHKEMRYEGIIDMESDTVYYEK